MWIYLLQGIGYGFAASSQPGPLQTYLISQTLTRGWKQTLPAVLAPLISDGPIVMICLFVLSQVPIWLQRGLYIVGGLFVLYLAYGTYKSWKSFDPYTVAIATDQPNVFRTALLNFLNPGPYLFWSLISGPILIKGWREAPVYGISFLLGFYITLIAGYALTVIIFGLAQKLGPKVNHAMLGISAVALLGFGVYQLWLGIF
ncbi:MAG: LysE family transporter [Anaerolineales bacterium]|nr:LysE family transporter [Anaerolineales bacterium]